LEKAFEEKLSAIMIDPSLLVHPRFWSSVSFLKDVMHGRPIYVSHGINYVEDAELRRFYGYPFWDREERLPARVVRMRSEEAFKFFSWKEQRQNVREEFVEEFEKLRVRLEKSFLPVSVKDILLDEFVFLSSQSAIFSRLKRTFKLLEQHGIPLVNLEKMAPDEWKVHVHRIKKTIDIVNWIAIMGFFAFWFGPIGAVVGASIGGSVGAPVTKGIRLFLIDP
jgi:hypothetical protein